MEGSVEPNAGRPHLKWNATAETVAHVAVLSMEDRAPSSGEEYDGQRGS